MADLFIRQLPAAFASIGEKHNALVDVIKSMSGAGGIQVKVSEANIIIDGTGVSTTGGGGGTEGAPIEVVGVDGFLNKVPKHSTWTTPTQFPTQLVAFNYPIQTSIDGFTGFQFTNYSVTAIIGASGYVYNDASITAALGTNGLEIRDTGTNRMLIDELGLQWRNGTITAYIDDDGVTVRGAGSVTSNLSSTGYLYEDASITAVLGSSGLRVEDTSGNRSRVDELGIDWTDTTITAYIDSDGFTVRSASATASINENGFKWDDGVRSFEVTTVGMFMNSGPQTLAISFSTISAVGRIELREIDVCVSGENKKMTILASDWY